jgi:ribose 5-phosphate isomerase A
LSGPSLQEEEKRLAGRAVLSEVTSGMTLGLGTGSTVRYFLEALAEALASGDLQTISGVSTSVETEERCRLLRIPTIELGEGVVLDLAVDGADEVSPSLDLMKGLGGALLREKLVVQAARRFVVIADSTKEVTALCERAPLPVEVVPFAWRAHLPFFRSLGADPVPRERAGALLLTDNGNHIVDLHFSESPPDPRDIEAALRSRAGVVETGFFLGMAKRAYIGTAGGGVVRERPSVGAAGGFVVRERGVSGATG